MSIGPAGLAKRQGLLAAGRTELRTPMRTAALDYIAFRTDRAPTVLVSLQPIKSRTARVTNERVV